MLAPAHRLYSRFANVPTEAPALNAGLLLLPCKLSHFRPKRSDSPKKVFVSLVHRIGLESNVVQLCDRSPPVEVEAQRLTAFPILSP